MSFWSARSSADSIGVAIRSTVRKAARLAVYDEIIMSVKNHQMPPTMRVEAAFGFRSELKYVRRRAFFDYNRVVANMLTIDLNTLSRKLSNISTYILTWKTTYWDK